MHLVHCLVHVDNHCITSITSIISIILLTPNPRGRLQPTRALSECTGSNISVVNQQTFSVMLTL